ncbi:MAG TPA: hypothetical protein VK714_02710 [Myxococcota bacterium]|nr:hypothetical protein [Myxococcota bacterium]
MRGRNWAALGLAAMVSACAHPGTEMEPEFLWVSTGGAGEAQFYRDTSDCLSRTATAAASEFVLCMNGKGWEQQALVGAARPVVVEHR